MLTFIKPTIPIMYRSVNRNGIIQDCNQHYAGRLEYTVEEVVGSSIFDHCTVETRQKYRHLFAKWNETFATNLSIHVQLMTKSGEAVDVVQVLRNRYEYDDIVGVDTDMRSISDIKKMQDLYNVHAREGYDDSDDLIRSVDYMGTIIDCNQTYLDSLGYKKDEVVGISLYEHTASRSKGNLHANMENWRTGHISPANIWMKKKDGNVFLTLLNATNETDKDGIVVGRSVALTPIDA